MNKRNFISFLLAVAFSFSMVLYASNHILASPNNANYHARDKSKTTGCPVYRNDQKAGTTMQCPALEDLVCPGITGCPGTNNAVNPDKCPALRKNPRDVQEKYQIHMLNFGSNCPYTLLEKIHRSPYIFIQYPRLDDQSQGKPLHEIRI